MACIARRRCSINGCKLRYSYLALLALAATAMSWAAAADASACASGDVEQGTRSTRKESQSYEFLCSDSFGGVHELGQLALSDALAFVPRAWSWFEMATKCVYAIDTLKLPSLAAYSSTDLQVHMASVLRSVMSVDKEPLGPPPHACKTLVWTNKTFADIFRATTNGGGLHPQLNIKASQRRVEIANPRATLTLVAGLCSQRDRLRRHGHWRSAAVEGGIFVRRHPKRNCNCVRSRSPRHAQVRVQSI
jgi:hypothetical protein